VNDDLHSGPAAAPDFEVPAGDGVDASGAHPRSRVVLYTSIGVAAVLGVFIAVLASAQPSGSGTSSSPLIGRPAPAVSGPSVSGGADYALSQFSGKWVLVNFAASWCVPCRQETPQLQSFADEHARAGNAVVLSVAFDPSDVANLASYLRSAHATWPTVDDTAAEVAYGVSQIPQSYLVDPSGTVVAKFFGALTAAQINKVITKADAAA
jgi:cytochrome c biogenesis protein CcmG/thiol:disulfide interchange protein DsbE